MLNFYVEMLDQPIHMIDFQISPFLLEQDADFVRRFGEEVEKMFEETVKMNQPRATITEAIAYRAFVKEFYHRCMTLEEELETRSMNIQTKIFDYDPEIYSQPKYHHKMTYLEVYIGYQHEVPRNKYAA